MSEIKKLQSMTELEMCHGSLDEYSKILAEWIIKNKKNLHIHELPIWEQIYRLAKKGESFDE